MMMLKPKFWHSKKLHFLSIILWPISLVIQILLYIKLYTSKNTILSVPVICVGNIYLGGTGKTPVSIKINTLIEKQGKKPTVIKKFYKKHYDEIELIRNKTGNIFFEKSRILAADKAIKNGFNVLVLDDGFQDYTIKKDLNILCFNEKQLIGNGLTIPAGPLRESLNSVKKCQIIIVNGEKNQKFEDKIKLISKQINIYYTKYIPVNIKKFENKRYLAFAGIGSPENFFNLLTENNIKLEEKLYFPDHYNYTQNNLDRIIDTANKNGLEIITTEKDFFRIKNLNYKNIDYLSINVLIDKEEEFISDLNKYI